MPSIDRSDYRNRMRRAALLLGALRPAQMPTLLDALDAHARRSMAIVAPRYQLNSDWRAYADGEVAEPSERLKEVAVRYRTTPDQMARQFRDMRAAGHDEDYEMTVAIYASQLLAEQSVESRHIIYCTEEMTALVRSAASEEVSQHAFTAADLPSPSGVAYLYDRGEPLLLRWTTADGGRQLAANLMNHGGIRRLLDDTFSDPDQHIAQPYQWVYLSEPQSDAPPSDTTVVTPFTGYDDARIRAVGAIYTLFALTHLSRQAKLAAAEALEVRSRFQDKKGRRRIRTDNITYLSYSPRSAARSDGQRSGRTYSHRWVVRGHWRRQWYPSQNRHIPIWITDYIAGPDDLPIEHRDRVTIATPPPTDSSDGLRESNAQPEVN